MNQIIRVFLFSSIFLCSHVFANNAADILQQKLSSFQTMQANFKQTILSDDGALLQESRGSVAISRPGKFRWDTESPMQQLILTQGKKVWIYDKDLQQVVIKMLSDNIGEAPIFLLTHTNIYLANNFNIGDCRQNKLCYRIPLNKHLDWFVLTPKDTQEMFSQIYLGFTHDQVTEMILVNQLGQLTKIVFLNERINLQLSEDLFLFHVPPHVDVIDQTRVNK